MGFSIKYVYEAIDRFTPVIEKVQYAALGLKYKLEDASKGVEKLGEKMEKFGEGLKHVGEKMDLYFSLPMALVGEHALHSAEKIDTFRASLEVLFQQSGRGKEFANALTKDILNFQVKTPFSDDVLLKFVTNLGARYPNISRNTVMDKLNMIGNISAPGGDATFELLSRLYITAQTSGKLPRSAGGRGGLGMLQNSGIPIITALMKVTGDTQQQIMAMAMQGRITGVLFDKALQQMVSNTGAMHNGIERIDNTLEGSMSKLKNTLTKDLGLSALDASDQFGIVKSINTLTDKMDGLFKAMDKLSPATKQFIWFGVATVALLGPVLTGLGFMVLGISQLRFLIPALSFVWQGFNAVLAITEGLFAFILTPVGAIVIGLLALGAALYWVRQHATELQKSFHSMDKLTFSQFSNLSGLQQFVYLLKEGAKAAVALGTFMHWMVDGVTQGAHSSAKDAWQDQHDQLINALARKSEPMHAQIGISLDGSAADRAKINSIRTAGGSASLNVGKNMAYNGLWATGGR